MDKIALFIAVTALGLSATAAFFGSGRTDRTGIETQVLEASIAALENDLAAVEKAVAKESQRAADAAPSVQDPKHRALTDALLRRLSEAESRLDAALMSPQGGAGVPTANMAALRADAKERRGEVQDATLPDDDRAAAFAKLRWFPAALGARDAATLRSAAELMARTKNEHARLTIARNMRGLGEIKDEPTKEAVMTSLVEAMRTDANESVREESAESLRGFRTVPFVRGALEQAIQSEKSYRVRFEIERSLHGEKKHH